MVAFLIPCALHSRNFLFDQVQETTGRDKKEVKMNTVEAIFWTQIPIAIAILIGSYELYRIKKELLSILDNLSKKR